MAATPDATILLLVYSLAGLYTATVYAWFVRQGRRSSDQLPGSERLGLSIVLGVLLLALSNNYLSPILGSAWTAAALLLAPAAYLAFAALRGVARPLVASLRPTLWNDVAAAAAALCLLVAIGHKLFFWDSLTRLGLFHPDLPWHVSRVAEIAFMSTPGFWPASPIAFPGPLPFISFVGDSLVAATFRYLPMPIHALTYTQVLFCWSVMLWTAVGLVAGSGPWRAVTALSTALLGIPLLIWGLGLVGLIVFVFFLANPNSLIAWPVALALTFHLYASYRRGAAPSRAALLLIPPCSLFFKANQAYVFGFLEGVGFAVWLASGQLHAWRRWAMAAAGVWAAAIAMTVVMGPWPISAGVRPSLRNLEYYAHVAFPNQRSFAELAIHLLSRVLIVAALAAIGVLVRSESRDRIWRSLRQQVAIPMAVLVVAIAYVMMGWWLVTPIGIAEGEPMHVNIELMMWLSAVIVGCGLCGMPDRGAASDGRRAARPRLVAVPVCLVLGMAGFLVWSLNNASMPRGGIPLSRDYDIAIEQQIRDALKLSIPDGNCFAYRRRFVIAVDGDYEPDTVMAATGCPVINGKRWRGYLGDNRPGELRTLPAIDVRAGRRFKVVHIGGHPG